MFNDKQMNQMFEHTQLERFVSSLVSSISDLGSAECLLNKNNGSNVERLSFCKEKMNIQLEELVRICNSSSVVTERVRTLLAHHVFQKYSNQNTVESTNTRLRELMGLLKKQGGETGMEGKYDQQFSVDVFQQLSVPRTSKYDVQKINPEKAWLTAAQHADDKVKLRLQDFTVTVTRSKNEVYSLSSKFLQWKRLIRQKKDACNKLCSIARIWRLKLLARSFGKLSRYATFLNALAFAARQGYQIKTSTTPAKLPWQDVPQRKKNVSKINKKNGRTLPWEMR